MQRLSVPIVFLLAALVASPVRAEGDDDAPEANVTFRVDLTPLWSTPRARGPNLATPADLIAHGVQESWNQDPGDERIPWLPFGEGEEAADVLAIPPDAFCELFQGTGGPWLTAFEEGLARIEATESELYFTVPASLEAAVREHAAWCVAAFSPTVTVEALLERIGPAAAVRGVGRVVVHPGRWTRVAFLKEELPCVVGNWVEIAQDAVVLNPYVQNLVEGHEIYVRMHPGESRSLLEVWAGDLEHVRTTTLAVDGLQGPLRTSEPSALTLPTTRVMRVATTLVLPTGSEVERTLEWSRGDVAERLTLRVRGPAAAPASRPRAQGAAHVGVARLGALHAALEHGARSADHDMGEWASIHLDRAVRDEGDREAEVHEEVGGSVVLVARAEHLQRVRAQLVEEEAHLRALAAGIELLAVPEEVWRAEGGMRLLAPGQVLPAARRQALQAGGAVLLASTRLALVEGVAAGFRVGESVPGLIDVDTEVAQEAAGLAVMPWALFDGIFGSLTARPAAGGWSLLMGGGVAWADPQAGSLVMTRASDGRRTDLPLLSGGGGDLAGATAVARDAQGPAIASVIVRGAEVLLVLVDLRAAN
jgi:hypothetical protein